MPRDPNNLQQTVSLLRKAYDVNKKGPSMERKLTVQNPKLKKITGVFSDPTHKQSVITKNAIVNKVFNINVKTEDGRTDFEDYPHEIDLQNYPQF